MNFLAIDTTMPQLAIAVSANGKHKSYWYDIAPQKHNSVLLVKINEVLKDVGCTLNDMDCFGVVIGPGSFTGIRVGVATINAFAFALRKNVVEMTSLELAVIPQRTKTYSRLSTASTAIITPLCLKEKRWNTWKSTNKRQRSIMSSMCIMTKLRMRHYFSSCPIRWSNKPL